MEDLPENYQPPLRPTWDEYFMMMAKLVATRSTCLVFPVGAVIVKDRQMLATGYNGSPSGSIHCTTQGYCYPGLSSCDASSGVTVPCGSCGSKCDRSSGKTWNLL
jgi:Deoxycytidylate deaminase